jgi:hypothetical protein
MQDVISTGQAHVLLTPVLREVVGDFARQPWLQHGLMLEVFRLLSHWFLNRHSRLVELDVSSIADYRPHPIPTECARAGWLEFWSDELGRLLVAHQECCGEGPFAIGVACDKAFSGDSVGEYVREAEEKVLPLVGPRHLQELLDAYEWNIDKNVIRRKITLKLAKENCFALGAAKVLAPRRDSHVKFVFPGRRPWTLSRNDDPVPDKYIGELCEITGFPLPVIRHTLILGSLPRKTLRFSRYAC